MRVSKLQLLAALTLLLALGITANASAQSLYIGNYSSNNVSVLNTTNNALSASPITVGSGPYGIALSANGRATYVSNYSDGTVSVIDTILGSSTATIPVGSGPGSLAVSPDGSRLYVPNANDDTVSVIDTATNSAVGSAIPVGDDPSAVIISANGRTAYVTNRSDGTVSVIDTATNTVVGSPIAVGNSPYGETLSPNGKTLYVANFSGGTISVVNTATNTVVDTIVLGEAPWGLAVSPDGSTLYAVEYSAGDVVKINTATNTVIGVPIPVGAQPYNIAITASGSTAYVANYGDGTVSRINLSDGTTAAVPTVAVGPWVLGMSAVQAPLSDFNYLHNPAQMASVSFNGASSAATEGSISKYAWDFGDGTSFTSTTPTASHTYSQPGTYQASLTVTDSNGCSAGLVYNSYEAVCNGGPTAVKTQTVIVPQPQAPKLKLRCPSRASGACTIRAQVVSRKKNGKPETSTAVARVKPGGFVKLTLNPKSAYRQQLSTASTALVKKTLIFKTKKRGETIRVKKTTIRRMSLLHPVFPG